MQFFRVPFPSLSVPCPCQRAQLLHKWSLPQTHLSGPFCATIWEHNQSHKLSRPTRSLKISFPVLSFLDLSEFALFHSFIFILFSSSHDAFLESRPSLAGRRASHVSVCFHLLSISSSLPPSFYHFIPLTTFYNVGKRSKLSSDSFPSRYSFLPCVRSSFSFVPSPLSCFLRLYVFGFRFMISIFFVTDTTFYIHVLFLFLCFFFPYGDELCSILILSFVFCSVF